MKQSFITEVVVYVDKSYTHVLFHRTGGVREYTNPSKYFYELLARVVADGEENQQWSELRPLYSGNVGWILVP